nr:ATP-binding protein [Granulosicoccus sp.]
PDEWHRQLFRQDTCHPEHDARHEKIETLQWNIAATALGHGLDVILDFGFWKRRERRQFHNQATQLGARTKIHFMDVAFDELLSRLEVRNQQHPELVTQIPLSKMNDYVQQFEAPDETEWALYNS